jgi:serine/threonine protein kinase
MLRVELGDMFVEEVNVFVEYMEDTDGAAETAAPHQRCVSIERPHVTLSKVVDGMRKNGGYDGDFKTRKKYTAKVCSVLRLIGKAVRHLHDAGAVHGNISMETCCKFEDTWKLGERLSVQIMNEPFDCSRFRESFPPEALEPSDSEQDGAVFDSDNTPVRFKSTLTASPSIDIWAFGKLAYECLVGKPLVAFDSDNDEGTGFNDSIAMLQIVEWDQANMEEVFSNLLDSGLGDRGADLITSCLFPRPEDRPPNMDEILSHEFWQEMKQYRSKRRSSQATRKKRGSRATDGSSSNSSPRAQVYEI